MNQFLMPEKIIYGPDSFMELGKHAAPLGQKALIISDPIMERIGLVAEGQKLLKRCDIASAVFTGVYNEPTDLFVDQAIQVCREEHCDFIIAIGGGSCIDTAKAVSVMMHNTGYIGDYRGGQRSFTSPPLPVIAIPTTAGTGAEVTKVTVIIDTSNDVKMMIAEPKLIPRIAIVDPLLTISCPPAITAATGMDALCHAIEAFLSRKAHVVTDALALKAIEMIIKNLPMAYKQGSDIRAREAMMNSSMMAGAAFSNASVTLVHGMSRPIGALFHVPHGLSNAMLLSAVLEFTRPAAEQRMAEMARAVWPALSGKEDREAADVFIREIKQLCSILQIPNLQGWGLEKEVFQKAIPKMAIDALASGSPANNPRVPSEQEIGELYNICYSYATSES
jgi:alcohol dehydrogenase class IV